jgi:RNA polymerase sigma-70 factor (ECF subfamily)
MTDMKNAAQTEFHRLWRQTSDRVRAYMFCACNDGNEADDLAQECYLRALRNWGSFDGRGSRQAWLFAVARNTRIDWLRRKARRRHIDAANDELRADDAVARCEPDEIEMVWEAVNTLRPDHKEVIHLRFAAGLSYAEMADALGIPVGTVRSRLHRSLKALREQIEE